MRRADGVIFRAVDRDLHERSPGDSVQPRFAIREFLG